MSPGSRRAPRNLSNVDPNSFGAIIRRRREEAGLSQEELGEAIGADQARISAYENNRFKPNEEMIVALARALNMPPAMLFESSQWEGLLPIGPERRKKLQQLAPQDWHVFDEVLDKLDDIGDVTPDVRAKFDADLRTFLDSWK